MLAIITTVIIISLKSILMFIIIAIIIIQMSVCPTFEKLGTCITANVGWAWHLPKTPKPKQTTHDAMDNGWADFHNFGIL